MFHFETLFEFELKSLKSSRCSDDTEVSGMRCRYMFKTKYIFAFLMMTFFYCEAYACGPGSIEKEVNENGYIVIRCVPDPNWSSASAYNAPAPKSRTAVNKSPTKKATCDGAIRTSGTGCCNSTEQNKIIWAARYCEEPAVCERNMNPKNVSGKVYWYNSRCNSSPQSNEQVQGNICDPSAKPRLASGMSIDPDQACECSPGVYVGYGKVCAASAASANSASNLPKCKNEEEIRPVKQLGPTCVCDSPSETVEGKCMDANSAASSPSTPPPAAAGTYACLADLKTQVGKCKTDGVDAVQKCDTDNTDTNKYYGYAQQAIGAGAAYAMNKGKEANSAEQCRQAGMLKTATWGALNLLKEDCSGARETCQTVCKPAKEALANYETSCKDEINKETDPTKQAALKTKIKEAAEKLMPDLSKGEGNCETKSSKNQDALMQAMKDAAAGAQAAAQCECQLTAGQTDCAAIQDPDYCSTHPGDINCPVTVDSTIPYEPPMGSGGPAVAGAGPAQLAAPFSPITANSPNFKGAGGGLGNLDLGSDPAAPMASEKTAGGAESPFGAAAGGGAGGGGSTPNGGGDGPQGVAEAEARSGIGGLFNALKTAAAGALGLGGKNSGDGKNFSDKNKNGKLIDPNAWRPLGDRGIAGGFGTKNMDIFKMVQTRYGDQYHTLMTVEAQKPK